MTMMPLVSRANTLRPRASDFRKNTVGVSANRASFFLAFFLKEKCIVLYADDGRGRIVESVGAGELLQVARGNSNGHYFRFWNFSQIFRTITMAKINAPTIFTTVLTSIF
jgi:hypothetical protein